MRIVLLLIFFLIGFSVQAQLGFCAGSKGDPIFQEDFGSGTGTGNPLPAGITNYQFVQGDPNDGQYTISDDIGDGITSWHKFLPSNTISGGRALIVNADFSAGRFYQTEISGLCENTTYEFSAFLMNIYDRGSVICPNGGIPVNVRFEIWDETDSILLNGGNTGDIVSTTSPEWEQYALTFRSEAGQNAVILKMFNNGAGGCGNDLAIDDIVFRSCGDLTTISTADGQNDALEVCQEDLPVSVLLQAASDSSVYDEQFFQWQESSDGENWEDIPGANDDELSSGALNETTYFRVKVAEDPINLSGNLCSSVSAPFSVIILETPSAPVSSGDVSACEGQPIPPLMVQVDNGIGVNWYDSETGGDLLAENTAQYQPEVSGTYYAESFRIGADCAPSSRTAVAFSISSVPNVEDEELQICPDAELLLDAGVSDLDYTWNTGATTQSILINLPGNYWVDLETDTGCVERKEISVSPVDDAEIAEVISDENSVTIVSANQGSFLYSLDGTNYQSNNFFPSVAGGIYTAYIKDTEDCKIDRLQFPHIVIPKYITPNNDGYNDSFRLNGLEYFDYSEIQIFDRYGKLLKAGNGANFYWNGDFNSRKMPSADYWYRIKISGFEDKTGNFSLIR